MLVLTSNGLSSDKLICKVRDLCVGSSKAVIVTTASSVYKERDWHIPELKSELESLGVSVDFFDFDVQKSEILLNYDVIEFIGGNPFYLINSMRCSNCSTIIRDLVKNKIVIGVSAGSLVMQKNINLIAKYSPEMNDEVKLNDLSGFGLTDIEILPHYSRYINKFERFEEIAKEYETENDCSVIRLDDGQGVFVSNDGHTIV